MPLCAHKTNARENYAIRSRGIFVNLMDTGGLSSRFAGGLATATTVKPAAAAGNIGFKNGIV